MARRQMCPVSLSCFCALSFLKLKNWHSEFVHKNTTSARPCAVALWRCKSGSRAQCTEHKSQLYLRWIVLPAAGTLGGIGIRMLGAGADAIRSSGAVTWVRSFQEADMVSMDEASKVLVVVPKPGEVDREGCGIISDFSGTCKL